MQGRLEREDSAQLAADPSGNSYGSGDLLHAHGAGGIQGLVVRNTIAVARECFFFKTGAEECRQEERQRRGFSAPM